MKNRWGRVRSGGILCVAGFVMVGMGTLGAGAQEDQEVPAHGGRHVIEPPPPVIALDPVQEAIQWLDRAAGSVHCALEEHLQQCGCWPPRGGELHLHRAVCNFQKQAREIRVTSRRHQVLAIQVVRLASAARDIERALIRIELPHEIDAPLQDALDIALYLEGALGSNRR